MAQLMSGCWMQDNNKPDVEVDIVESLASLFYVFRSQMTAKHDQVVLFHDSSLQYRGIQELQSRCLYNKQNCDIAKIEKTID
jgi:hypothetical protein